MAFPTVQTSATSKDGSYGSADLVCTMPTGITAGDLLLAYVLHNVGAERNYAAPSGWTQISRGFGNSAVEGYVYAKVAAGSDGLTVTKAAGSSAAVAIVFRITGNYGSGTADVESSAFANSFANPANPPALTPSWGSTDVTWFVFAQTEDTFTVSSYPTNYADNNLTVCEVGATYRGSSASRELAAASEDPGVFTYSGSPTFGQLVTVAVRGGTGGGGGSPTTPLNVISPSQGIAFASAARRFC